MTESDSVRAVKGGAHLSAPIWRRLDQCWELREPVEMAVRRPSYWRQHGPENAMLYALMIYEKPTDFARRDPSAADTHIAAWRSYYRAVADAGIYVGGNALDAPDSATTVRLRDDKRQIQDGPYANTKEQLGGVMVLELPSLDAALEWAARCPAASYGAVEVRPVSSETDERVTGERNQW